MPAFPNQRAKYRVAMVARLVFSLPFGPTLGAFCVPPVPKPPLLRSMPLGRSLARCLVEYPVTLIPSLCPDAPSLREMLGRRQAFEIWDGVVKHVPVAMVDVAPLRDGPKGRRPNIPMKALAAPRKVLFTRPNTIEAAIEILRVNVKHDWIDVPGARLSADIHPLPVMNIWSGVHFTERPSANATSTSGAFLRVILGLVYGFQPHGVRTSPWFGRELIWHIP
jgi:hypothetical protein